MSDRIEGNIVNVVEKEVFGGSVEMKNGFITAIHRHPTGRKSYIMPGFVDAHMHIESSMLTPENIDCLSTGMLLCCREVLWTLM